MSISTVFHVVSKVLMLGPVQSIVAIRDTIRRPACSIETQLQFNVQLQAAKMTIALTSATGKLGGGVLNDVLENKLIDTKELVVCV
jgi:hypothetical protein